MKSCGLLSVLFISGVFAVVVEAGPHHARQLSQFVDSLKKEDVVVFDLDDTLMDLRPRRVEVLKRFTAQEDIQKRFPKVVQAAKDLTVEDIGYSNETTMVGVGILKKDYPDFFKDFHTYFMKEFFSGEAVAWDEPIAFAKELVQAIYRKGVWVVYLTGRSEDTTKKGTLASLKDHGFPIEEDGHVKLLLKPTPKKRRKGH